MEVTLRQVCFTINGSIADRDAKRRGPVVWLVVRRAARDVVHGSQPAMDRHAGRAVAVVEVPAAVSGPALRD